jgi:hypothetical protein
MAIKQSQLNFNDRVAILGGGYMGFITAVVLSKIIGKKIDPIIPISVSFFSLISSASK